MQDVETKRPFRVSADGTAGPYLMVPLDQLDDVRLVLNNAGIAHAVSADAIQLDGRPVIAVIDFGRSADPVRIQQALDAA
jgi:hypothetical protein